MDIGYQGLTCPECGRRYNVMISVDSGRMTPAGYYCAPCGVYNRIKSFSGLSPFPRDDAIVYIGGPLDNRPVSVAAVVLPKGR